MTTDILKRLDEIEHKIEGMNPPADYMTIDEAAHYCRMSKTKFRQDVLPGLPVIRVGSGRHLLIERAELVKYLKEWEE